MPRHLMTDDEIEKRAADLFKVASLAVTNHEWDWDEASEEVKDRFRKSVKDHQEH
jgi:hypothetical protein